MGAVGIGLGGCKDTSALGRDRDRDIDAVVPRGLFAGPRRTDLDRDRLRDVTRDRDRDRGRDGDRDGDWDRERDREGDLVIDLENDLVRDLILDLDRDLESNLLRDRDRDGDREREILRRFKLDNSPLPRILDRRSSTCAGVRGLYAISGSVTVRIKICAGSLSFSLVIGLASLSLRDAGGGAVWEISDPLPFSGSLTDCCDLAGGGGEL